MSGKQFLIFLIYLVPFAAFFVIALHVCTGISRPWRRRAARSISPISWR
jgi:hypothetical protein